MSPSIFSLFVSAMLSRALFVSADLNIADYLAQKPMTVQELAQKTSTESSSLARLLYFLELHDVFAQDSDKKYHLTEFSRVMCADHPQTIRPILLHEDPTRWNCIGNLGFSIKTGAASFDMLYGTDYFAYLKNQPLLSARFNEGMDFISCAEDEAIATCLSFNGVVADVGGCKGQLINAIVARNGDVEEGILFDLPEVVAQAQNLHECCSKYEGSFFEPLSFTADIFILKRILHDWDDEKASVILKNVSDAMSVESTLYIIEGILDVSQDKKSVAAADLFVLALLRGAERTKNEFERLVEAAGLEIVSIRPIDDLMCAIECKKRK